jgi:MoxR-like ATPase
VDQISTIVVGKRPQIEDCMACLLAGGHLLIEDVPGVGKTTLAHALAVSLGLDFRRVQFTADLMPSDLIGVSVFERAKDAFVFHQGPVFAQVLLADEINRAGPKTQSALLEAMEEQQVSVENETRAAAAALLRDRHAEPQRPAGHLPAAGKPARPLPAAHHAGLPRPRRRTRPAGRRPTAVPPAGPAAGDAPGRADGRAAGRAGRAAAEPLLDYLQALIAATRSGAWFTEGLSPRAGIMLLRAAKARALMAGRDYVAPDDVQAILPQAVAHRLVPVAGAGRGPVEQVRAMVEATPFPEPMASAARWQRPQLVRAGGRPACRSPTPGSSASATSTSCPRAPASPSPARCW